MHTCHAILSKGSLCRVHRLLPLHYEVLAFNFVNFSIFIAISCYRDYLLNPWHYKYDHLYLYKFLVYTVYKNLMSFVKFYLHIIILFILSSLHHTSSILLPSVKREPLFCFHVYVHIQKHLDPLVKENIDYLVFLRPSLPSPALSLYPLLPTHSPLATFMSQQTDHQYGVNVQCWSFWIFHILLNLCISIDIAFPANEVSFFFWRLTNLCFVYISFHSCIYDVCWF